ncbi:hypothetical protein MGYG_03489 [Nannizzia gypsea CBS 118893]|uniref:C6 finger domain transcription factor nscR n=1 Tax=Arthroderma gypseum (strain ATCC MYA-4604 / CBS 118893) TaxID=535722 RepID=E4US69_ARTGP|nr:hypothetical protein MGYG_03489 [Nannizzia gypsea CBS 118893]EFR00487.1 hypothetical protein MGYG_03489 [Nannizzia gypsea CBS 118893]
MGKPSQNLLPAFPATDAEPSDDALEPVNPGVKKLKKTPAKRRALSCLPCRRHKLKCNRHVPCHSCIRYRREEQCRLNPPPSSVMRGSVPLHSQGHVPPDHTSVTAHAPVPAPAPAPVPASLSFQPLHTQVASATPLQSKPQQPYIPHTREPDRIETIVSKSARNTLLETPLAQSLASLPQNILGVSTLPPFIPLLLAEQFQRPVDENEVTIFWCAQLVSMLPLRHQCDLIVNYYINELNYVYHSVHAPSFREDYAAFWNKDIKDTDIIWLSFLYSILSTSAVFIPFPDVKAVGLDPDTIRKKAHLWHWASRQALSAGHYESRPCLTQLETFLVTQLYWLSTKNVEALNSALGQAVRNGQALNLDRDVSGYSPLETEKRRRIWWELFCCDTFQSMCMSRTPLIHCPAPKIPLPANCNDVDITDSFTEGRPIDEPTETSASILRAEVFLIMRKLFDSGFEYLSSYEYVRSVDTELANLTRNFPWYFQLDENGECANLPEHQDYIVWQFHLLHSCICMQRIRMNRPFIHTRAGDSWAVCAKAANEVLAVYQSMRNPDVEEFRKSHKLSVQSYQIFSAAVALAGFLLVERSFPADNIRPLIEMVISDLELCTEDASIAVNGRNTLIKMLDMYDRRQQREPVEAESLVPEISVVFGGEQTTRKYLKRCEIGYVLNEDGHATPSSANPRASVTTPNANTYGTNTPTSYTYNQVNQSAAEVSDVPQGTQYTVPNPPFSEFDPSRVQSKAYIPHPIPANSILVNTNNTQALTNPDISQHLPNTSISPNGDLELLNCFYSNPIPLDMSFDGPWDFLLTDLPYQP